jgi:glyoxylase-like metal-dependent hydrolase (beta-lactamase superfamily II)
MRLRDRIHLVGSGSSGLYLTDAYDAHAFMVVGDREAVLIDAGCGRDVDALLRVVIRAGVDPSHVSRLLLTHAHADHCGGAAALRRRLPHLRVCASVEVAEWVERADEEAMSVDLGRRAEFYPPDYTEAAHVGRRHLLGRQGVAARDVGLRPAGSAREPAPARRLDD